MLTKKVGDTMIAGRSCGILLHVTSLPGRFGIGGLGRECYAWIDFLADAGQKYWQILPYGPVSRIFDGSPYMSLSAFAGNPLFIDPQLLVDDGLLDRTELENLRWFSEYTVDFDQVIPFKKHLLARAFAVFAAAADRADFDRFCRNQAWLDDYALFSALREQFGLHPWHKWPAPIAQRDEEALASQREMLAEQIFYHKFVQYVFWRQWQAVLSYAREKGVHLIGDIPIYVALDSADVWANQDCFDLDPVSRLPNTIAGVPPDYFSETGQRWGNPLFLWNSGDAEVEKHLYAWWASRFRHIFEMVDMVRIDHFRGFESYWEIPSAEKTAINGKWVQGPGLGFFKEMGKVIGDLPIIAEDLGIITPEVNQLRDALGFPGMKILQFAFDSDEKNAYLPHNYESTNCVVYTGTHDNDTTVGWFFSETVAQRSKERALRYAHSEVGSPVHWDFLRMAYSSTAALALVPLQDALGFGSDCRMNTPSTSRGNWRWRCAERFLTEDLARRLRDEAGFYNRLPAAEVAGKDTETE